jgi:hypothetical protein
VKKQFLEAIHARRSWIVELFGDWQSWETSAHELGKRLLWMEFFYSKLYILWHIQFGGLLMFDDDEDLFIWDNFDIDHIARHGVLPEEAGSILG